MGVKISDLLGQSPSLEVTTPTGDELFEISEPQGTSPETYVTKVIRQSNLGSSSTVGHTDETANFTLALDDASQIKYVSITGSPLADITCTIPTNASVAFPVGTIINFVLEDNGGASPANKLIITGDTGVTVNGTSAGSVNVEGNYTAVSAHKKATDEWVIVGGIS
ncbi:MAG TPA: hypothetical protein V6D20_25315 [Candidatus Obscuribacterales bacterium]